MGADTHARVKNLLADALTLPSHEREAFVRAQSDDAVIVREVLELLAQGTDLISPVGLDDLGGGDELVGTQVGHYRIVDRLDAGGQGEVYLGRDTDLHRKVALKSLLPSGAAADVRSAALREARAAAQVTHPNVATIHHVLEHNSRAYIVMEFVEGESLAKVLRRGRLPLVSVYAIGRQLAGAVAAAHSKGVVHRDLKPANVQVLPDGSIKVLDFGIAGVIAAVTTMTRGRAAEVAQAGQPGTPGYMAPEQVTSAQFDERTDIFSLGILLFEMATGTRAYPERETQALLSAAVRPLPRADHIAPDVPEALADIIEKAVQIDPDRRFGTAVALAEAIERIDARPTPEGSAARRARQVGAISLTAAAVLVATSLLQAAVFNQSVGREPPFDAEPVAEWLEIGARSFLLPGLTIGAALVVWWVGQFAIGLFGLVPPFGRWMNHARATRAALLDACRLRDPRVCARAAASVGLVAILVIIWTFRDLLAACTTGLSTAPAATVAALGDGHLGTLYRALLSLVLLGGGWAWVHVRRLYANDRSGLARAVAPIVVISAFALLLMQFPYRLLSRDEFPHLQFEGQRCGVVGRTQEQVLLFCSERTDGRIQRIPMGHPAAGTIDAEPVSIFNVTSR